MIAWYSTIAKTAISITSPRPVALLNIPRNFLTKRIKKSSTPTKFASPRVCDVCQWRRSHANADWSQLLFYQTLDLLNRGKANESTAISQGPTLPTQWKTFQFIVIFLFCFIYLQYYDKPIIRTMFLFSHQMSINVVIAMLSYLSLRYQPIKQINNARLSTILNSWSGCNVYFLCD